MSFATYIDTAGPKNEEITSLMDLTSELTENLEKIVIDNKDTIENQQNPKNEEVEEAPTESSQHTLSKMLVQRNNSVFPTEGMCVALALIHTKSLIFVHVTSKIRKCRKE